ncbi:hypothetical protein I6J04_01530 [Staphylococcus carnosus]|uniref:DUF7365 family protein n=1 Tax=Staphylococcus carnosus TaxID=1281 RepID=UPI00128D86DD|nr:hypothetical protein [Staphylococcus carnosus]QQS85503.1 hypothetical protein I6J04_01530 [Staphylococcus carnosus]UTC02418.1 hypothetical protein A2I68_04265 [Staphylococcus carnosus]
MNVNELTTWFIFSVLPIALAIATFAWKISKDKKDNENRITRIESEVEDHNASLKDIKEEQKQQREDTKVILEVSSKIDSLNSRFDKFEDRFYTHQNNQLTKK